MVPRHPTATLWMPADGRTVGHLDDLGGNSSSGLNGSILKTEGPLAPPPAMCRQETHHTPLGWGGAPTCTEPGREASPQSPAPSATALKTPGGEGCLRAHTRTPGFSSLHPQSFKTISICCIFQ